MKKSGHIITPDKNTLIEENDEVLFDMTNDLKDTEDLFKIRKLINVANIICYSSYVDNKEAKVILKTGLSIC